jgi:uncharacterized RDD family membrane protein YckC
MTIYKFAGFWRRLVAFSIDGAIIAICFFILTMIASVAFFTGAMSGESHAWIAELTNPGRMGAIGIAVLALYILLFIAFFTYFHGLNGRTPGKKLLGLQVVSADGSPISFGVAFLRSVGYLISSLLFTVPLGYIWAAFDRKKQGWHDKIAGTVVIIREPEGNTTGIYIPDSVPVPQATQSPIAPNDVSAGNLQASVALSEIPSDAEKTGVSDQKIP